MTLVMIVHSTCGSRVHIGTHLTDCLILFTKTSMFTWVVKQATQVDDEFVNIPPTYIP